jgi:uncharacterized RDD family membrane protein YckC
MPYCKKCGAELPEGAKFCPKCGTAVLMEEVPTVPIAPAAPEAPATKLAFWGERFVAWLIDIIILGVIVGTIGLLMWWFAAQPFTFLPGWPSWMPFFNFGPGGVIYFIYWTFMEGAYAQSIGKMAMRIRVTRLDGSPIGMTHAALESMGKAFLLPLDCLLGWMLYPRRRQRIFNYLSETIVIRET